MKTYKDLSYLIGTEVTINRDIREDQKESGFYREPDRIIVENEYPDTILLRIEYPEHSFRRMITKAAMFCGDERIRLHGWALTGKAVREQ